MTDLKKLVFDLMQNNDNSEELEQEKAVIINKLYKDTDLSVFHADNEIKNISTNKESNIQDTEEFVEESLSLEDKEKELISKALEKHKGKRKNAAIELGISERTLYRKIKEYDITK